MELKAIFRQSYRLMVSSGKWLLWVVLGCYGVNALVAWWHSGLYWLLFLAEIPLFIGLIAMGFRVWQGKPLRLQQAFYYYTDGRLGRTYSYGLLLGVLLVGLGVLIRLWYLLLEQLVVSLPVKVLVGVWILPAYVVSVYMLAAMAFVSIYCYNWAYTAQEALKLAGTVLRKTVRTLLAVGWGLTWRIGLFSLLIMAALAALMQCLSGLHPDDLLALALLLVLGYGAFVLTYLMVVSGGLWQALLAQHLTLEESEDEILERSPWFKS